VLLTGNKTLRQIAGLAETCNFLFLKLLLKNRAKARQFPGEIFRSYMGLVRDERWACRSIFELFPQAAGNRVVLEHIPCEGLLTPLEQLACLALITKCLQPRAIFEIGTYRGRTALNFALNSPKDCTIHTLDLPPGMRLGDDLRQNSADRDLIRASSPGACYEGKDVAYKIEQLYGDSKTFDFAPYRRSVDIVYVDAAHDYEAVCSDSENALAMVRANGCVIWDEFANYGEYNDVTRGIQDVVGVENIVHVENTQLAVYFQPAD